MPWLCNVCCGLSIGNYMPTRAKKHQFYCNILLSQYYSGEHSHPKSARCKLTVVENSSYMCICIQNSSGHNMHKTTGTTMQIDFPTLCKLNTIATLKHVFEAWVWSVAMSCTDFYTTSCLGTCKYKFSSTLTPYFAAA
jgi:hypothetical protein